jgi:Mycolic acid cyclopropane synthetase
MISKRLSKKSSCLDRRDGGWKWNVAQRSENEPLLIGCNLIFCVAFPSRNAVASIETIRSSSVSATVLATASASAFLPEMRPSSDRYLAHIRLGRARLNRNSRGGGRLISKSRGSPANEAMRQLIKPEFTRYIFPNSMLPSPAQVAKAAEKLFVPRGRSEFWRGLRKNSLGVGKELCSFMESLQEPLWREVFRMWRLYLLSCAGAFRVRNLQVFQFLFSKGGTRYLSSRTWLYPERIVCAPPKPAVRASS